MTEFVKPPPLEISYTSKDREKNLHCFQQLRKIAEHEGAKCRKCGADLTNWRRVQKREIKDVEITFKYLQFDSIRHHFFHQKIDETALRQMQRKGPQKLIEAVRVRLLKYLVPENPTHDGRQTPYKGNIIFFAQHATATCCRTCLEYWHEIPKYQTLEDQELDYCCRLIELYIDKRMPEFIDCPVIASTS